MGIETKRRDLPSNRAYKFQFHWFVTAFSDDENDRRRRTIDNLGLIFFSLSFAMLILELRHSRLFACFLLSYFVIPRLCNVRKRAYS